MTQLQEKKIDITSLGIKSCKQSVAPQFSTPIQVLHTDLTDNVDSAEVRNNMQPKNGWKNRLKIVEQKSFKCESYISWDLFVLSFPP